MSTTWYVSLYAQPDLNTCWRASLRMMLSYQGRRFSDSEWEKLCRSLLLQEFGGARPSLADFQIDQVAKKLGLRSSSMEDNKLDIFVTHIATGPVMFPLHGILFGHMVVAVSSRYSPPAIRRSLSSADPNYSPVLPESFEVADPCATGHPRHCRAGIRIVSASEVESSIGKGYIWYWK